MCLFNGQSSFSRNLCRRWCSSVFVIIVFCLSLNASEKNVNRITREVLSDSLQNYLMNFGYMEKSGDGAFALRTEETIRKSLSEMQAFAGLPVTGQLDERTKKLMATPRCGLPDRDLRPRRSKRFTIHGPKWPYTRLKWSIRSKNVENLNFDEVRYVMSKALAVWSRHSQLIFTEVDSDDADILIYFYRGDHRDNFPFDGRGTVLAHAFFPTGHKTSVEVHFDADETWNTHPDSEEGTNLFNVAAHEIGHSLGLSHSNVESALMYPWYKKMENGFDYELPDDDKQAIQFLYGSRDNRRKWAKNPEFHPVTTTTTTTTTTTPRPRPRVVYPNRPKIPYDPHYPQGRPYGPRKPQERPYVPRYPQEPTYDPRKPPERPYEPHKPDERPYDPYSPHYPQTPMNPNKKHYPKQDNDQYPYNADRRKIHHKHKTDRIPERNYPDRVHPTKVFTTKQPEKYPQHIPAGNHPKETTPKESPTIKPLPDTCDTSYDAISVIRQEVFIFKDAYFWRIDGNGLLPDYPALINRLWQGLPRNLTHVDAVYERSDGRIIFFIGNLYYRFSTNRVDSSYPKPLTHLGIPREITHIDGAMVWGHNGKTYLYSGDRYWSFDEELQHVELDYPRHISMWKGVGTDIDAVFQWKDGKTYFFKGKGFWKFNDLHMRVEEKGQKLSAPFWMGCTTNYRQNHTVVSSRTFMASGNSTKHNTFNIFVLTIIIFIYSQLRNI